MVATQIDAVQQRSVNEAFCALDLDGDGQLSREELRAGLGQYARNSTHLDMVLDELDIGRTGTVSYTEFLAGVINLRGRSSEEQDKLLWVAWQQFCPDQDGLVKKDSIQGALAARGMTVALIPEELLEELSKAGSEYLTFDAFKRCLLREPNGRTLQKLSGDKQRGAKMLKWMLKRWQR